MRRVLFDRDVLLDVLAQRQPFVVASAQALNAATQIQVQGYVSGHAMTDMILMAQAKFLGASDAVIATTNVGHLARYISASLWQQILPN